MTLEGPTSTNFSFVRLSARRSLSRFTGAMLVGLISGFISSVGTAPVALADSASLDGSWRGSGWVKFDNGKRERARCKAFYSRVSPDEFKLRANCATKSAKATQTARVYRTGKSKYSGTFFNQEFGVSGNIYVSVKGRSQNVRLTGSGGSATFRLRK